MGKNSAPPPPDYAALAAQQGQNNLDTAKYNAAINRVDQHGPQGSVTWQLRPGADPNNPQPGDYIQTTQLSPEQQGIYNQQNQITAGLLDTGLANIGRVSDAQAQPFDTSGMQAWQTSVKGGDEASRLRVEEAMMSRMNPQLQQQEEATRNRLAAAGIPVGSDAWNAEMTRMDQARNDARMQATLAGGQEESRQFGMNLQAAGFGNQSRQGQIQEQAYLRQLPLNELNALRTGGQVSMPQFQQYYTGAQAQSAPYFDAGVAQGNYDLARYGTQQGGYNALMGGLANLGSAWIQYSDRRLKTNFEYLGSHPSGVARYAWTWADGSLGFGVVAQDLQKVRPDAVREVGGYLAVDYAAIGGF